LNTYLATRGSTSRIKSLAEVMLITAPMHLWRSSTARRWRWRRRPWTFTATSRNTSQIALRTCNWQGTSIDATNGREQPERLIFPANNGAGIAAKSAIQRDRARRYLTTASPFGITFTGKAYSEATLITLAYAFEQATKVRQPPGPPGACCRYPPKSNRPTGELRERRNRTGGPGEIVAIPGSGLVPRQRRQRKLR